MSDLYEPRVPVEDSFAALNEIRNHLASISFALAGGMFLAIRKDDGTVSLVNLTQAAEIHFLSKEECLIKFVDGGVVAVNTEQGVSEVLRVLNAKDVLQRSEE